MGVELDRDQSVGEEVANAVTHGIGWAMSIAALVLLIIFSARYGNVWHVVSCSVFGAGLVLLFANSTMYHALHVDGAKRIFKIFDHSAIYFLIAATYTPYTIAVLRGVWGWVLFGIVWSGFILGTLFKVFLAGRFKWLSVTIYVALGWCVLVAIKPLMESLAFEGILLLFAGGVSYTLGALVYGKKGVKYSHAVWHIYVILGALFHFLSVFYYVIPIA